MTRYTKDIAKKLRAVLVKYPFALRREQIKLFEEALGYKITERTFYYYMQLERENNGRTNSST